MPPNTHVIHFVCLRARSRVFLYVYICTQGQKLATSKCQMLVWPVSVKSTPNMLAGKFVSELYCISSILLHPVALHSESQTWSNVSVSKS